MRIFSLLIILWGFSLAVQSASGSKIQPNKHYPANSTEVCTGLLNEERIKIWIKEDSAVLIVAPDTPFERQVTFQNVVGVRDAEGIHVYTAKGFALFVNHVEGDGIYMGATGLGAWNVQKLQSLPVNCKEEKS